MWRALRRIEKQFYILYSALHGTPGQSQDKSQELQGETERQEIIIARYRMELKKPTRIPVAYYTYTCIIRLLIIKKRVN